jgi:hypothetical protein
MAVTRAQFEAVFKNVVVPELIADAKATGLADTAIKWMETVCSLAMDFSSQWLMLFNALDRTSSTIQSAANTIVV